MPRVLNINWAGPVYMVAGKLGEGISNIIEYSDGGCLVNNTCEEFSFQEINENYVKVEPMLFFKNGVQINFTHQGVFNDHRKI